MAFDQLDPISVGFRTDFGSAMVASMLASVNRDPKQRKDPYLPTDLLVKWDAELIEEGDAEPAPPTPEELLAKAEIWALMGAGQLEEGGVN